MNYCYFTTSFLFVKFNFIIFFFNFIIFETGYYYLADLTMYDWPGNHCLDQAGHRDSFASACQVLEFPLYAI